MLKCVQACPVKISLEIFPMYVEREKGTCFVELLALVSPENRTTERQVGRKELCAVDRFIASFFSNNLHKIFSSFCGSKKEKKEKCIWRWLQC